MTQERKQLNFDTALRLWERSAQVGKDYARICAEMAIRHFAEHGDLSLAQRFVDSLERHGKNYLRWRSFVIWLTKYSPAKYTDGKFTKDQSETAKGFNLDAALSKPFWDDVPDREAFEVFDDEMIVRAFQRLVKRYRNSERFKPKDDLAIARLDRAEKLIDQLVQPLVIVGKPADEPQDQPQHEQAA